MRRVYVALILLVTVSSMAWYKIAMPLSCYTLEYPTCHLHFLSIHTHLKACVHTKNTQVTRGIFHGIQR